MINRDHWDTQECPRNLPIEKFWAIQATQIPEQSVTSNWPNLRLIQTIFEIQIRSIFPLSSSTICKTKVISKNQVDNILWI